MNCYLKITIVQEAFKFFSTTHVSYKMFRFHKYIALINNIRLIIITDVTSFEFQKQFVKNTGVDMQEFHSLFIDEWGISLDKRTPLQI